MTRSLRRWTTWLCLCAFLFAQGTLAAYACPLRAPAPPAAVGLDEACPGHAHAVPAPGDERPLCQAHCEGQSGVTSASAPVLPPLVLAPFPVTLAPPSESLAAGEVARAPIDANAAAPPIALQYCRLLI